MKLLFAKSVQGYNHQQKEKSEDNAVKNRLFPCQDKSFAGELTSDDGTLFNFLAVSDGHGGDEYFRSEIGADFAISTLKEILIKKMGRIKELIEKKDYENIKVQLAKALIKVWKQKIDSNLHDKPITEQEYAILSDKPKIVELYKAGKDLYSIYGCTLVAFFSTDTFWYAIQIGDGDFAISLDGEKFFKPIPEDEKCFLNQTTSLCDTKAETEFRYATGDIIPKLVFCSTDGVANSFKSDDDLIDFYKKISSLITSVDFADCQSFKCSQQDKCDFYCKQKLVIDEIEHYLPILSKKGSGDDISLVCSINIDDVVLKILQANQDYLHGCYIKNNPSSVRKSLFNNPEKSMLNYFVKAAKARNSNAFYELGLYYHNKAKSVKAIEFVTFSANLGNSDAMLKLGEWYSEGYNGEKKQEEADIWYEKAAAAGNHKAIELLEKKKKKCFVESQDNLEAENNSEETNKKDLVGEFEVISKKQVKSNQEISSYPISSIEKSLKKDSAKEDSTVDINA